MRNLSKRLVRVLLAGALVVLGLTMTSVPAEAATKADCQARGGTFHSYTRNYTWQSLLADRATVQTRGEWCSKDGGSNPTILWKNGTIARVVWTGNGASAAVVDRGSSITPTSGPDGIQFRAKYHFTYDAPGPWNTIATKCVTLKGTNFGIKTVSVVDC